MGIVAVGVMDGNVGAHPLRHKLLPDEILQERGLLLPRELNGQRGDELPRQAAVLGFFRLLHGVPELLPVLPFQGCHWRQEHRLPDKPLFAGVVVLHPIVLVEHPGAAQIGGSGHSGAPRAPADHLRLQMIDRHSFSFPPAYRLFLFLFTKRKWARPSPGARPSLRQSCRWQVCAGRRQLCGMAFCHPITGPAAWTMTAAPAGLWHRPAAPAGDAIPLGEHTVAEGHTAAERGPRKVERLCGERRRKGADAVFAVRRKRRQADFATTRW